MAQKIKDIKKIINASQNLILHPFMGVFFTKRLKSLDLIIREENLANTCGSEVIVPNEEAGTS
jgi:hypothetical protein